MVPQQSGTDTSFEISYHDEDTNMEIGQFDTVYCKTIMSDRHACWLKSCKTCASRPKCVV